MDQCKFNGVSRFGSPSLAFDSNLQVTNLAKEESVGVEIGERGPVAGNRSIDASQAAVNALVMIDAGTATVRI